MLENLISKIFSPNASFKTGQLRKTAQIINSLELKLQSLPEEALREKTKTWQTRLALLEDRADRNQVLDEILPEAFAVVKNACRRLCGRQITVRGRSMAWDMIPFDVQLMGGIALHHGRIAEMATGEGKTLAATLPAYLNALAGQGVHIVTVNDYLAARDSEWMGAVFQFLGLTVGCILNDQPPSIRRQMYACDITYGTNAEFGFDYLRDNGMARRTEEQVQRNQHFAIIDEIDSILLDEARTPLIITGPAIAKAGSEPYELHKPKIHALVQHQARLSERYLREARALLAQLRESTDGTSSLAELESRLGLLLYKMRMGAPKSEGLMELLEDPENLRRLNAAELRLHSDQSKQTLYAQKEELFFAIEEKSHEADLTEKGRSFLAPDDPDAFVVPDLAAALQAVDQGAESDPQTRLERKVRLQEEFEARAQRIHTISQLLKAYCLYEKDVHYVIQEGKIVIVDEHTGRLMPGRRWSDGLHQAVEAKEGVAIENETQTLATITIQNYFRLYRKLAGMTGTAETEAGEFRSIYRMDVQTVPSNKPVVRQDRPDSVYKTRREKFAAVVREIQEIHAQGRPVLAGTVSVEASEYLSKLLAKAGIMHSVLNAKFHQQEAEIVARAGQRGTVTIATNMAGRGTDIKLGPGVAELGGLHVLGTERHEARRIDRQLRGRCARQGDPGTSHFFVSMEDDLMRLYGSESVLKVMMRIKAKEGRELRHPLLSRSIEATQKREEQHHFQTRKQTLEYDNVMNKQREIVYAFRNQALRGEGGPERILELLREAIAQKLAVCSDPEQEARDWDLREFTDWLRLSFFVAATGQELVKIAEAASEPPPAASLFDGLSAAQFAVANFAIQRVQAAYELKARIENPAATQSLERLAILNAIDQRWQEHLSSMDGLRHAIGLRAYGQRDPLIEYQAEAFKAFEEMMFQIKCDIGRNLFRTASSLQACTEFLRHLSVNLAATSTPGSERPAILPAAKPQPMRSSSKCGRNDPCPCGSGRKYKACCGA